MNKTICIIIVAALVIVGCTPYPRYRKEAPLTPKAQQHEQDHLTTNQFMRLGLILQRYLGKPYKGRSKYDPGLDCSSFTHDVFREYNKMELPRTAAAQFGAGRNIPLRQLRYGDLVFFKTGRNGISHVGVALGRGEFIHASTSRGVIISSLSQTYWAERLVGARRIIE